MGLDMFLFKRFINEDEEVEDVEFGYWRKFWPLHSLITDIKYYELFDEYGNYNDNCVEMELNFIEISSIISTLEEIYDKLEPEYKVQIKEGIDEKDIKFSDEAVAFVMENMHSFDEDEVDIWYYDEIVRSLEIFKNAQNELYENNKAKLNEEEAESIHFIYYAWY